MSGCHKGISRRKKSFQGENALIVYTCSTVCMVTSNGGHDHNNSENDCNCDSDNHVDDDNDNVDDNDDNDDDNDDDDVDDDGHGDNT